MNHSSVSYLLQVLLVILFYACDVKMAYLHGSQDEEDSSLLSTRCFDGMHVTMTYWWERPMRLVLLWILLVPQDSKTDLQMHNIG